MSLRARLLFAVAAVALVALAGAGFAVYAELRSSLYSNVDASLETSHMAIEHAVAAPAGGGAGSTPPGTPTPSPGGAGEGSGPGGTGGGGTGGGGSFCQATAHQLAPGLFVEVRSASGAVVTNERCPAIEVGYPPRSYSPKLPADITGFVANPADFGEKAVYFTAASTTAGGPTFRVRASKLASGGELVVAIPLNSQESTLDQLLTIELASAAAALAIAVALGWWLVRVGLRPLREVERTAEAISGGDLTHRVPGENTRTEVGHVARALNVMLGRIQVAFRERDATEARLRRFVADASHELRTPIAAVSAYAELFERQAALRREDLERVMSGIRTETARMGSLVEDLLLLARLDDGRPLAREPVELVGLANEAIETAAMVGPDWPVRLEASGAVEVTGEPARLRQVINNLLANVRAHTPSGTSATVRVRREGAMAVLEVEDDGPGINPDEAAALLERFYRSDASRARSTGGAGLGLAIVASIVSAHGGEVSAASSARGGAVFRIVLPVRADQDHPESSG